MKKKFIFLGIIAFFFTGCTVDYNLEITKDLKFKEEIIIDSNVMPISESEFVKQYKQPVSPDSTEIYDLTTQINEDNQISRYYYEHNNNFSNNTFINRCYHGTKITQSNDKLILKTSKQFQCMSMYPNLKADKVDINITTKLHVTDNNADEVKGNKYTWHITEKNAQNKTIILEMKKPKTTGIVSSTTKATLILVSVLSLFGILGYHIIKTKKIKNNNL